MTTTFNHLRARETFVQYNRKGADSESTPKIKHSYRGVFSLDRDRVMYSMAFRRLSSKTQVFHSKTTY